MLKKTRISIYEVVGSHLCVASDDGQKVFDYLNIALENDQDVELSFLNVKTLTSAFLNAAIGQLYGKFDEDQIRSHLEVKDADQDDLALLKRVVDNAKLYFKNPERFNQALQETLGDEDNEL